MDLISEIIPVRPLPGKKLPGAWQFIKSIKTDLIGFWPEPAYRIKAHMQRAGVYLVYLANSPETVEHVFVKNNQNYNRKTIFMRRALESLLGDGLFISEGEVWRQRRGMEEPGFKPALLRNFANLMTECALECQRHWETNHAGKPVLMLSEMATLTSEVLCRCLFGRHLGRHNANSIISGFSRYQALVRHFDLATMMKLPSWLHPPQSRKVQAMADRIHQIVDDIIASNLKDPGDRGSLLTHMLSHYKPGDPDSITLQQIRNEIVVLLMAGHETTANSLAWTWYLLAEHPRVAKRLHEELDTVLGDRVPDFNDVPKLTYTRAVFEEALRLYPPVPILSREAIGEDQIGKHHIPKGTLVVVAPWLLHRHRVYWEHPDHFVPERFTGEWPRNNPKYTYIPFSTGPRNCLGAAFGLTEAILCLAVLARRFDPALQPGYIPGYECRLTLRPSQSLPMIARLRC